MALSATVRTFEIQLADIDRGIYEQLSLRVGQHPSESDDYLVTRVLAYCLELEEGLVFTSGLSAADEPALWVRDLTGQLEAWIEIGCPDPARLHKARKGCDRVAVYCHKDPNAWLRSLAAGTVHQLESIRLYRVPWTSVKQLAASIDRRNTWTLTRTEGTVFIEAGDASFEFALEPLTTIPDPEA